MAKSTVEEIRDVLRREIAEGFRPGDLLPNERELAERFEVSRNTIRETMIHLEALSLIEKTKRGARVRTPDFGVMFQELTNHFDTSARSFTDVLNFRRINETGAAPLMVCHVTDAQLDAIRAANARMVAALTAAEAAQADYDFHYGLVQAAGNEVLARMYDVLSVPLKYYLEVGKSQELNTATAKAQHDHIIAALESRDAAALAQALADHFQHSGEVLASWLATRERRSEPITIWPVQRPIHSTQTS
ncbi:FadR/GntR family transcriptional regulator [Salipiger thiooxidans]|uniref:FadR/GntR family transcriptional regulator n=1 Tax=Salipiger thiooxidans TaxID=282683 RepID=UPI001A8CF222|nr:FCD domain-containing protein [Salipiger thiooxidans]MBN8187197.1 FadR family transcriptional regulator [Salipiger thiooxidans]MBR9837996.1 FadR family transcriptional regulator [Paracoccaceae bacterium]MCA0847345.1 FCD domain-containing protein [Salipiger thiooxidans]